MMPSRQARGKASRARRRGWASTRWSRSVAGCASALATLWRSSSQAVTPAWEQGCCSQGSLVRRTLVRSQGRRSPHAHCPSLATPARRRPARHLPRPGHGASANGPRGRRHGEAVRPPLHTVGVWVVQAPAGLSQPAPGAARSCGDDAVPPWGGGRRPWPARPPVPLRRPLSGAPAAPARGDVRRGPLPWRGGTPRRLPLAGGQPPCAPCRSYPHVVHSSPRVVAV